MKWRCGGVCRSLPVSTRLHDALPGQLAQFMQSLKERGFFFLGTAGHTMAFLDIFEGKFRPHELGGERRDLRSARAFALLTSRRFELTHPLIFKLRAEIVLHRFVLSLCSDSDFIKRLYPRPLLMRDIAQHPRGILAVHLVYLIQEFTRLTIKNVQIKIDGPRESARAVLLISMIKPRNHRPVCPCFNRVLE